VLGHENLLGCPGCTGKLAWLGAADADASQPDAACRSAAHQGGVPGYGLAAGTSEQMLAAALRVWTSDCALELLTG
jgi:hypothetical protein